MFVQPFLFPYLSFYFLCFLSFPQTPIFQYWCLSLLYLSARQTAFGATVETSDLLETCFSVESVHSLCKLSSGTAFLGQVPAGLERHTQLTEDCSPLCITVPVFQRKRPLWHPMLSLYDESLAFWPALSCFNPTCFSSYFCWFFLCGLRHTDYTVLYTPSTTKGGNLRSVTPTSSKLLSS